MANQKVLIIDDGKTIRMQIREMLPQSTFEVLEAKDGLEGINMIKQEIPNLILLDFFMPKMNGWEVIEKMKDHAEISEIPLVLMSGKKEEVLDKIPHLFEQYEFLEKPFDQKILITAIKSAFVKAKERKQTPVKTISKPVVTHSGKIGVHSSDEIQGLKAEIKLLKDQNAKMHHEIESLKKQMS
ncbi:MAG TPA: response regulator, partial [Allocoleopsis sp.]